MDSSTADSSAVDSSAAGACSIMELRAGRAIDGNNDTFVNSETVPDPTKRKGSSAIKYGALAECCELCDGEETCAAFVDVRGDGENTPYCVFKASIDTIHETSTGKDVYVKPDTSDSETKVVAGTLVTSYKIDAPETAGEDAVASANAGERALQVAEHAQTAA